MCIYIYTYIHTYIHTYILYVTTINTKRGHEFKRYQGELYGRVEEKREKAEFEHWLAEDLDSIPSTCKAPYNHL
jgi:alpha-galactosidase/6-phospho-beta-glucosidase family protein